MEPGPGSSRHARTVRSPQSARRSGAGGYHRPERAGSRGVSRTRPTAFGHLRNLGRSGPRHAGRTESDGVSGWSLGSDVGSISPTRARQPRDRRGESGHRGCPDAVGRAEPEGSHRDPEARPGAEGCLERDSGQAQCPDGGQPPALGLHLLRTPVSPDQPEGSVVHQRAGVAPEADRGWQGRDGVRDRSVAAADSPRDECALSPGRDQGVWGHLRPHSGRVCRVGPADDRSGRLPTDPPGAGSLGYVGEGQSVTGQELGRLPGVSRQPAGTDLRPVGPVL